LYRGLESSCPTDAREHVLQRYPNGRKSEAAYSVAGRLAGYRRFHLNGLPEHEHALRDSRRHGYQFRWDIPGKLLNAEPYENGLPHGVAMQWSDEGNLVGRYTMIAGTGLDLWWHWNPDGGHYLSEMCTLRDGASHGFQRWFNEDSSVSMENHWWYGLRHGIEREWNERGRLRRSYPRFFIAGKRVTRARYAQEARRDPTLPPYNPTDDSPARPGVVRVLLREEARNHRRWLRLGGQLPTLPPLYAGILIGGKSRRMGSPKHLLQCDNQMLIERTVAHVRPYCRRVHLIGAGKVPRSLARLPRIADQKHVSGPLAGMTAAFARHSRVAWLFVACDLPRLNVSALEWLVAQRRFGRTAVVPRLQGGELQPVFAIYEPSTRESLERAAHMGGSGPRDVGQLPATATPGVPGGLTWALADVDTPQDFARLQQRQP
jgi:molybdopterin-guanine dinucleotide biosynthesis protein A/antitoxin component YwqK of YwqJK toxin-antitoxin module